MSPHTLQVCAGAADCCELLSKAFAFPTKMLVEALVDGRFLDDACSSLRDAGEDLTGSVLMNALSSFVGLDKETLGDSMNKGYSLLFLAPGADVLVWPYESAFLHVKICAEGAPSLFRTKTTLDVERQMTEAGVRTKNHLQEPADSVWNELSFLSYLLSSAVSELAKKELDNAQLRLSQALEFWESHVSNWIPDLMEKTCTFAKDVPFGSAYVMLAEFGSAVMGALDQFFASVASRKTTE